MAKTLQLRRGTAAAWTAADPVLAAGEPGFEEDTNKFKLGDGTTAWSALAYAGGGGSSDALALSERVLSADFTIPADHSAVVVGPLYVGAFTLTIKDNAALAVI